MTSTCLSLPPAQYYSGDNYDFWAIKMHHLLKASDLWDIVDKDFETPVANEQPTEEQQKISEENLSKNEKALFILQSTVSDKIFPHIMDATTAKEAWNILQKKNQGTKKKEVIDWTESMRAMQYHSGEKSNISNKSVVLEKLRKENEDSYKPKVVSIGPRFRGSTRDLLKMEKTKWEYLSSLLNRVAGNAESKLADCGELILGLEEEVRPSYVDLTQMKWRDMANIMLYDACFVLELLNGGLEYLYLNSSLSLEEREKISSDLLVLDNQIPFSILQKLYRLLFGETDNSIETQALNLFGCDVPDRSLLSADIKKASNFVELVHSYISMDLKDGQESKHHILEIKEDVRPVQQDDSQESNQLIPEIREDRTPVQLDDSQGCNHLIPEIKEDIRPVQQDDSQESNHLILEIKEGIKCVQLDRCATMLRAAGVKINPLASYDELQPLAIRIRFNKSTGTLDIPELYITETTKAWWLNLIALEHHKMEPGGTSETVICKCTSAALFFNALICCESDVQLLKDKGIIMDYTNMSNKDLVAFFRSIVRGIHQDKIDSRYNIFDVLNKYYSHPIRRRTQMPLRFWHYLTGFPREALRDLLNFLKRGYNFTAAVITILSLLQTIYAVLSYYHPKK